MKIKLLCFLLPLCLVPKTFAQNGEQHTVARDFLTSVDYMKHGSYQQFQGTSSYVILGAAALVLAPLWGKDKKYSNKIGQRKDHSYESLISDLGVLVNFPVISGATYALGRNNHDEKMINYSQELFAATNMALAESVLISFIPIHKRPTTDENLTFWEKNFRDESSFPSGHTVGYAVLTFKTFQYYGPMYAAVPAGLLTIASIERVKTEKHFLTDVVASTFIALLTSEGTRKASQNKNNHPYYKWIFEHEVKLGFLMKDNLPFLSLNGTF